VRTFTDVTVTALKIAPVRDLEFKIPEGRDGGGVQNNLPLKGGIREGDQVFGEAKLDEFFIFLPYRRTLPPADAKKKLIPIFVQFIEFIFFDVVEVPLFEIF
jgi:hypothetical protein